MIKLEGNKFAVYNEDGTKKLGSYDTEQEAQDRSSQISKIGAMKLGDKFSKVKSILKISKPKF